MKIELKLSDGTRVIVSTDHDSEPPTIDIEYPFENRPDLCISLTTKNLVVILPMLNAFATMYGSSAANPDVTAIALGALEIERQAERGLKGKPDADQ